ncbi:MAG: tetratricopeptide repeat protein [Armatimonadota bacterium]|jgi:tetratricopeptide (TPR) repeat protein
MRIYRLIGVAIVIAGLLGASTLHGRIRHERTVRQWDPPAPIERIVQFRPTAITGVIAGAMLGGFRGPAANLLWLKMETFWHSGKWHDCYYVMQTVTWLDPHFVEAWRVLGWHLMYNMPVETKDIQRQEQYMQAGVAALKEGIAWNPDVYDLYWELGWNYFDKMDDFENSPKWFRAATQFEHPEHTERLIAHAYEKLPDMDKALDAYDYCLKRYPRDGTAIGATLTIRERYLEAWRLLQAERYDDAVEAMQYQLEMQPGDHIGNRLLATIYERDGDLERALKTWDFLRHAYALDSGAARKVRELKVRMGAPDIETDLERQERLERERVRRLEEEHRRRHIEEHGHAPVPPGR